MESRFRLRDNERFQTVRREGQSWPHTLLVLCALANGLPQTRFGFSVSKRIGGAVVRNRVKRWLREATRARRPQVAPGYDLVFIARRPIAQADYSEVDQAVGELLKRSGMLHS